MRAKKNETLKKREKKGGVERQPFFAINDDIVNLYGNTIFKTRDAQVFTRRGSLVAEKSCCCCVIRRRPRGGGGGGLHDTLVARGKRIFTRNCDSRDTTQLEKSWTFEETNTNGAREFTRRECE